MRCLLQLRWSASCWLLLLGRGYSEMGTDWCTMGVRTLLEAPTNQVDRIRSTEEPFNPEAPPNGVHEQTSAEEARSLFLNTYLFVGEILHLGRPGV